MIFSTAVTVSVLSLLSCTWASTLSTRQGDCVFGCPETDADGNALSTFSIDDTALSCSYSGEVATSCIYDTISGNAVGDNDGCLEEAVQQCLTRRQLKQVVARRAVYDPRAQKRSPAPSPRPKRAAPSPTSDSAPRSWPSPKPKSSPSPSPPGNPPKKQPCNYRCPFKDLAKNPLTDEAIRDSSLYCGYPSSGCESCSFCKYSTRTGLLLEDNDEGNCPQTATLARPWDRRYS